eukprot:s9275_g1.t1
MLLGSFKLPVAKPATSTAPAGSGPIVAAKPQDRGPSSTSLLFAPLKLEVDRGPQLSCSSQKDFMQAPT